MNKLYFFQLSFVNIYFYLLSFCLVFEMFTVYNMFMEDRMFTEERRHEIIRLLKEKKSLSVLELSDIFNVSGTTIRTDLTELEAKGYLRRTHGGAVLPQQTTSFLREPGIKERAHFKEKQLIAEAALSYLESYETILVDNGTTMAAFDTALARSSLPGLTVYSNDLYGMQILEDKENCELRLIGGSIRSGFHYTYGPQVLDELRSYHFKKLFLATSAFSKDGLTTANSDLGAVKSAMIASAEQVILLADSSKFGKIAFRKFADLKEIHTLITDSGISNGDYKLLKKHIPDVVIV